MSNLLSARSQVASAANALASMPCTAARPLIAAQVKTMLGLRVYWLRIPQTHLVAAYDRLVFARTHLAKALAGRHQTAARSTLSGALATANAMLGTSGAAGFISAVVSLAPARNMKSDDATMRNARKILLGSEQTLQHAIGAARAPRTPRTPKHR